MDVLPGAFPSDIFPEKDVEVFFTSQQDAQSPPSAEAAGADLNSGECHGAPPMGIDLLSRLPYEIATQIPLCLVPTDLEYFRALSNRSPEQSTQSNVTSSSGGIFQSWFTPQSAAVSQATVRAEQACSTLRKMAMVSRSWNALANEPRVWKHLYRLLLSDKHRSATPPSAHPHHLCNFTLSPPHAPFTLSSPALVSNLVPLSLTPADICAILRERVYRGLWKPSDLDAPYGGIAPEKGGERWLWKKKVVDGVRKMVLQRGVRVGRLGEADLPLLHHLLEVTFPRHFAPLLPVDLIFRNKWKWSYAVAKADSSRTFVTMDELTRMTWAVRFANPSWLWGWDDTAGTSDRRIRARHLRDGHLLWEDEVVLNWRFLGDSEGPQPTLPSASIEVAVSQAPAQAITVSTANGLPPPLPPHIIPLHLTISANVVPLSAGSHRRVAMGGRGPAAGGGSADPVMWERIKWHVTGRERFVQVEGYPAKLVHRTAHWAWILANRNVAYEPQSVTDPQPLPKKRSRRSEAEGTRKDKAKCDSHEDHNYDRERPQGRKRYNYSYDNDAEETEYESTDSESVSTESPLDETEAGDFDWEREVEFKAHRRAVTARIVEAAVQAAAAAAAAIPAVQTTEGDEDDAALDEDDEDGEEEEDDEENEEEDDGDDVTRFITFIGLILPSLSQQPNAHTAIDPSVGPNVCVLGKEGWCLNSFLNELPVAQVSGLMLPSLIPLESIVGIPNNSRVLSLGWENEGGYIACGGDAGLLKVIKLESGSGTATSGGSTIFSASEPGVLNEKPTGSAERIASDATAQASGGPFSSSTSLTMNQTLTGHSQHVTLIRWNAIYTKLTTADASGLIIVWILYKGAWYEEMVNNRGKSTVADMRWDPEGRRICIAYRDGTVISGSVDGARLWSKNLGGSPTSLVWSPDGTQLLFAMDSGEVQLWDYNGGRVGVLESLSNLFAGPAKSSNQGAITISSMEWFPYQSSSPSPFSLVTFPSLAISLSSGTILLLTSQRDLNPLTISTPLSSPLLAWSSSGTVLAAAGVPLIATPQNAMQDSKAVPQLLLLSRNGTLLRHLRIPGRCITSLTWDTSTCDQRLAVGVDSSLFFVNVRYDKWDQWGWCEEMDTRHGGVTRSGVGGGTVVYSWNRSRERHGSRKTADDNDAGWGIGWWNVETGSKVVKSIRHFHFLCTSPSSTLIIHSSAGSLAPLASLSQPLTASATALANSIPKTTATITNPNGTTVTSLQLAPTSFVPTAATLTSTHAHIASGPWIVSWEYRKPKQASGSDLPAPGKRASVIARIAALDAARRGSFAGQGQSNVMSEGVRWWTIGDASEKGWNAGAGLGGWTEDVTTDDPIVALTACETTLIVARSSGTLVQFSLPTITLQHMYSVGSSPLHISVNSTATLCAVLDTSNVCRVVQLSPNSSTATSSSELVPLPAAMLPLAQKDVTSFLWSSDPDSPEHLAMVDKSKLLVFNGSQMKPEEPVAFSGWLLGFKGLEILGVVGMEQVARDPDDGWDKTVIASRETEAIRKVRELISDQGVLEAHAFVEANPHPRLWRLVADAALDGLDFNTAMKAFVKCTDWGGITLVKRVSKLDDKRKQRAEIATYYGNFHIAESIYLAMERPDLAFDMHVEVGNYEQALRLVEPSKTTTSGIPVREPSLPKRTMSASVTVSDKQKLDLYDLMGDQCREASNWREAVGWYKRSNNVAMQVEGLYMSQDWEGLSKMVDVVEDGDVLKDLAVKLTTVGMWESAVAAYLKAGDQKAAVDACIYLNQWAEALRLAQGAQAVEVRGNLEKFACYLLDRGRRMECVELYRCAGMPGRSATMLYDMANEVAQDPNVEPLSAKKMFVLAALEAGRYKDGKRGVDHATMDGGHATLDALLTASDPVATGQTVRLPENLWKAAEAWHYYMLAQSQFYAGDVEPGYVTALHLKSFDDVLDPRRIFALLAILSFQTGRVATGGKALGKLESMERAKGEAAGGEVGKWKAMAKEIFQNILHSVKVNNVLHASQESIKCSTEALKCDPGPHRAQCERPINQCGLGWGGLDPTKHPFGPHHSDKSHCNTRPSEQSHRRGPPTPYIVVLYNGESRDEEDASIEVNASCSVPAPYVVIFGFRDCNSQECRAQDAREGFGVEHAVIRGPQV
ncbi:hypothetical protein HDU93_000828 [Gonapodya sp. JEL0774]|nr:hypothetical protein HDU93_000828 [Gonapodya sp. JEL0774]